MANKSSGLGKGLGALLGDNFSMEPAAGPSSLPLSGRPDPDSGGAVSRAAVVPYSSRRS